MVRFADTHVFREQRFSIGSDRETGGYFLSTPVSGHMAAVEFEGYFSISAAEYRQFSVTPDSALRFLHDCRMGRHSDRRLE